MLLNYPLNYPDLADTKPKLLKVDLYCRLAGRIRT